MLFAKELNLVQRWDDKLDGEDEDEHQQEIEENNGLKKDIRNIAEKVLDCNTKQSAENVIEIDDKFAQQLRVLWSDPLVKRAWNNRGSERNLRCSSKA